MFTKNEKNHIITSYKICKTDRDRKTCIISLAIEYDILPKFIREVLIMEGFINNKSIKKYNVPNWLLFI